MFNNTTKEELNKLQQINQTISEENKALKEELSQVKHEYEVFIRNHYVDRDIWYRELQTKIDNAIDAEKKTVVELTIKKEILTKEVEMLRTAFNNLGFDVKDMKSILDKLVDGIVKKNDINIIK